MIKVTYVKNEKVVNTGMYILTVELMSVNKGYRKSILSTVAIPSAEMIVKFIQSMLEVIVSDVKIEVEDMHILVAELTKDVRDEIVTAVEKLPRITLSERDERPHGGES